MQERAKYEVFGQLIELGWSDKSDIACPGR